MVLPREDTGIILPRKTLALFFPEALKQTEETRIGHPTGLASERIAPPNEEGVVRTNDRRIGVAKYKLSIIIKPHLDIFVIITSHHGDGRKQQQSSNGCNLSRHQDIPVFESRELETAMTPSSAGANWRKRIRCQPCLVQVWSKLRGVLALMHEILRIIEDHPGIKLHDKKNSKSKRDVDICIAIGKVSSKRRPLQSSNSLSRDTDRETAEQTLKDGMAFALSKTISNFLRSKPRICFRRKPVTHEQTSMAPVSAVLDRDSFSERWKVYALRVPAKLCNGTRKVIREHTLNMPRVLSIVKPTEEESKASPHPVMVILLKYFAEEVTSKYSTAPRGNTEDIFVRGKAHDVAKRLQGVSLAKKTQTQVEEFVRGVEAKDISIRDVKVEYLHWSIDAVLRAHFPANVTIPSSFETIGHIAHLNLRDEHAPYKKLIGEVMLDKLGPRIKSIVNKLQSTGGPYRTFKMEVLAGDGDMETTVKESGCTFKLNFADVYWNSRLETEHRRIVESLKRDDILVDAFCGIGPFTVPASKQKRCKMVYANDLNPASVKYLNENVKLNKLDESHISTSCSCARSFLRKLVQEEKVPITRVVMNFPAGAPEFLDVFRGLYNTWDGERPKMPLVHCYCFVKGVEDIDDARRRVRTALFATGEECAALPDEAVDVREVRDVAPRKRQVCVTFQVPESIAFSSERVWEPPAKKAKTELVA